MLSDKKAEKIHKALGKEQIVELEAMDENALKSTITQAQEAIKSATEAVEASPKYQELKDSLSLFNKSLSELKRRQNAITQYNLHLLEEKGK